MFKGGAVEMVFERTYSQIRYKWVIPVFQFQLLFRAIVTFQGRVRQAPDENKRERETRNGGKNVHFASSRPAFSIDELAASDAAAAAFISSCSLCYPLPARQRKLLAMILHLPL
jgi:hypothetical protein